ncbi:MAG: GNAT family N-acetyltransferase [Candidatus Zixiibacteriota bacterium]
MEYLIRHLDSSDYEEIISLWSRTGLSYKRTGRDSIESMSKDFKRPDTCFFGMFDGNKMIGVVIATSDGRKGWINRLAIDPDYRGRSFAGYLIREAENFLHGLGIKVIAALIEDENTPSMSTFTKEGYICMPSILYFSKRGSDED